MLDAKDEIKSRLNIVDVLSEYITLRQAGTNFRALCPFHNEKTPSFMISPEKQIWHCFGCFPSGSLIKTEEGPRAIEKIKVGQKVLTHQGRYMPVIRAISRKYEDELVEIKIRKSSEAVILTSDHEVFIMKTKNCSQKARQSRICQLNCKQNCPRKYFKDYKIEKVPVGKLTLNDYLLYPINKKIRDLKYIELNKFYDRRESKYGPTIADIPHRIKINGDFLKLVGYYIAEGSNHRAYIRFSLGNHEGEFADEIVNLIQKIFKIRAAVHKRITGKTGLEITACNSKLANIFENLCGKGSDNKHIPFEFQFLPPKKQKVILEAVHKGDGYVGKISKCKRERSYKAITTTSLILAEQLKDILLRLDIAPTLYVAKEKIDKNKVHHKKAFTLSWQDKYTLNFTNFYKDSSSGVLYWISPIKSIKKEFFKGKVYNLTVDKDHSYTTQNFTVGNCGEGGDIFTFVMKIEGAEFPEAMRILAAKAGVQLKKQDPKLISQKTKLLDACQAATDFFQQTLKSPAGKTALEYLKKRGLTDETVEKFQLGYAPESWDTLLKFLTQKGFNIKDIDSAGLVAKKQGGVSYYDRFRDRVMFPIADTHGNVVGFTGRILKEDQEYPSGKYVNSPETPIYNKGHLIYALDQAKIEIKKKNLAVLVEGQMDVIASHQAGITNVIASSGTALTLEQITLLKRYTANLALSFDEDVAGQEATRRGIDAALAQGMNIKIIRLPFGKDPDECIAKDINLWTKAIESSKSIMEYYFDRVFAKLDLSKVENRKKARDFLLSAIGKLSDRMEQDFWIKKLAEKIEADEEILREELKKKKSVAKPKYAERGRASPAPFKPDARDKSAVLGERLLALALKFPENLEYLVKNLDLEILTSVQSRQLAELLLIYYTNNIKQISESGFDYSDFTQELADQKTKLKEFADFLILLAEKEFAEAVSDEISAEIQNILKRLKINFYSNQLKESEKNLQKAEKENNQSEMDFFTEQFVNLSQKLGKIDKT